jgi:hypothetical protein
VVATYCDELGGEPGSRFVPVLLGIAGVAADIGDEDVSTPDWLSFTTPVSMANVNRASHSSNHAVSGSLFDEG